MMLVAPVLLLRLLRLLRLLMRFLTWFLMRHLRRRLMHFLMRSLTLRLGVELRPLRFLLRARLWHLAARLGRGHGRARLLDPRLAIRLGWRLMRLWLLREWRMLCERGLRRRVGRAVLDMRSLSRRGMRLRRLHRHLRCGVLEMRRVDGFLRMRRTRSLALLHRPARLECLLRHARLVRSGALVRCIAVREARFAAELRRLRRARHAVAMRRVGLCASRRSGEAGP